MQRKIRETIKDNELESKRNKRERERTHAIN